MLTWLFFFFFFFFSLGQGFFRPAIHIWSSSAISKLESKQARRSNMKPTMLSRNHGPVMNQNEILEFGNLGVRQNRTMHNNNGSY
jgi:hypothetical protein